MKKLITLATFALLGITVQAQETEVETKIITVSTSTGTKTLTNANGTYFQNWVSNETEPQLTIDWGANNGYTAQWNSGNLVVYGGQTNGCTFHFSCSGEWYVKEYTFKAARFEAAQAMTVTAGGTAYDLPADQSPVTITVVATNHGDNPSFSIGSQNKGIKFTDFTVTMAKFTDEEIEAKLAAANTPVKNTVKTILTGSTLFTVEEADQLLQNVTPFTSLQGVSLTDAVINAKKLEVANSFLPQVRAKLTGKQVYFKNLQTNTIMTAYKDGNAYKAKNVAQDHLELGSFWSPVFNADGAVVLHNIYYDEAKLSTGANTSTASQDWANTTGTAYPFKFSAALDGSFVFQQPGNDTQGINCYTTSNFGYWNASTSAHTGSYWFAHVVNNEMDAFSNALLATVSSVSQSNAKWANTVVDDDLYAAYSTLNHDKSSIANYKALEAAKANAEGAEPLAFSHELYWRLTPRDDAGYLCFGKDDNQYIWGGEHNHKANVYTIVQFEQTGETKDDAPLYYIKGQGNYFGAMPTEEYAGLQQVTSADDAGKYYITHEGHGTHVIRVNETTFQHPTAFETFGYMDALHFYGSNNSIIAQVQNWNPSKWNIELAEDIEVALNLNADGGHFGVGFFPFPVQAADDSELLYIFAGIDKESKQMVLSYTSQNVIPANTPFLIKNESSATANLAIAYSAPMAVADPENLIAGSLRAANVEAGDYVFGVNGDSKAAFTKSQEAPEVASNSIYLPATAIAGTALANQDELVLNEPEKTTTGLGELSTINHQPSTIYDLQGRRLSAPVKGINIIDGKKILKK